MLSNVLSYLIAFIVIMMILDTFHVPTKTMLAGTGVAGLAIGFGAQNLVRGIIEGIEIPSPRMVVYAKDEEAMRESAH